MSISPLDHICTDPSHPPIIRRNITQETLYERVSNLVAEHTKADVSDDEIVRQVASELIPELTKPSNGGTEGFRLQQMRQQIARDWGEVFYKLDNLGYLTGWFINECHIECISNALHFVLCLFALEAIRNMFATVNQLRVGLSSDTFVYWRTLYETLVKSRLILKFREEDKDLPDKFLYYTNSAYLKLYKEFAPKEDSHAQDNMWIETERKYESQYEKQGKGDYGWIYPNVKNKRGEPIEKPNFRRLIDEVDKNSKYSKVYYGISTSKSHGRFIFNPLMVRPEGRGTYIDSFSVGDIGLVLDLMLPLFKEILENTAPSCSTPAHGVVMDIVKVIIKDISNSVARIKASNPDMHGSFDP